MSDKTERGRSSAAIVWSGLLALAIALGFVFSVIQPPGGPGDEDAHVRYIRFLADRQRLPVWEPSGGGEAGYEAQHPPLYYAVGALVYDLTSELPENWRWYALRWYTLALGLALFLVARGFCLEYFHGRQSPAIAAAAAFALTPTTLLHVSYVNVDLASVLMCSLVIWMCLRVARGTASMRDRVVLAVALGLGLLTKLTAVGMLPAVVLAHVWDPNVDAARQRERRIVRACLTLLGAAAIAGWWYARNSWLHGTPFIHSEGRYGSGLFLARETGQGLRLLWVALRETSLSTFAQRSWLPRGAVAPIYAPLAALVAIAVYGGLRRGKLGPSSFDPAPWICGITFLTLCLGHQAQVWFSDYEFNAGGRYLLNGLMGGYALMISGLYAVPPRRVAVALLVAIALAANAVSVVRIWTVLNPRHYPEWRLFELTPQGDPGMGDAFNGNHSPSAWSHRFAPAPLPKPSNAPACRIWASLFGAVSKTR